MSDTIDSSNQFAVGARMLTHGKIIVIERLPVGPLSPEEANRLAAWLVAIAGNHAQFHRILEAIEKT